jgi:DNA-binding transcriptional ArsR family regulator
MSSYDIGMESHNALAGMPDRDGRAGTSVDAAAELFKAVAHPVRAQILELLTHGECTIPELCEGTGLKPSHLSRHLTQMRGQHLIHCVRSGGRLVYRLAYPEAAELLAAAWSVLRAQAAAAVSSLGPVPEEQPFTSLWGERYSAPEAALVSRSVIADACQAIAARTGCTPEAAAGRLIITARTCKITLLEAALEELRNGKESSDT